MIDLRPTLLAAAGVKGGNHGQGRNLLPLLMGERETLDENWAFIETDAYFFKKNIVGVRTPTHLYGAPMAGPHTLAGEWGFYDLREDPYQIRNLAGTDEQAALGRELRAMTEQWHQSTRWLGE